MLKMKYLVIYIFVLFALTSCFEEDEMVPRHETGDLVVGEVELTENYKYQVFFDLETNSGVKQNLISEWDLGFETSDSGWHVILNTSKMMLAGNTGQINFDAVTSKNGIEMNFDVSSGNKDSLAIGNWYSIEDEKPVSDNNVYIIDRGTGEDGKAAGIKKVSFDFQNENTYLLRFANLDGTAEQTVSIRKDSAVTTICYSFDNGIVNIQPSKNEWNLLFTKYSTMLTTDEGEPYPYLVTGILLNEKCSAVLDTLHNFEEITYEIAEQQQFSSRQDLIGYDWKKYDFDNGMYTVLPEKVYIIRDTKGYFYKLRFIDYYNSTGEQGYPTFEFLRL